MGLVADTLHQIEALRGAREHDRRVLLGTEELLALLRQRHDRDLQAPGVSERVEASRELALPTVEDHEVRQRPGGARDLVGLRAARETAPERLAHVREVV